MSRTTLPSDTLRIGARPGYAVVESAGPLARLNYFDGKFLRAPDLKLEQNALLMQARISNQGHGGGFVHGFDARMGSGDEILVSAGLGYDWQGRPLLLSQEVPIGVGALIAASAGTPAGTTGAPAGTGDFGPCAIASPPPVDGAVLEGTTFYVVTAHHMEALCGEEDVYGKLCSEACVEGTARSRIVEGVAFRATPITLSLKQSSVPFTGCHLRSRAASAYFALEATAPAPLINANGVLSPIWCLGADQFSADGVPVALLGRSGGVTRFLDAWAVRRECIDTPPKHYWSARMAMRSTRIYWAQIAQFQCMLECCLKGGGDAPETPDDGPCGPERRVLRGAADSMRRLLDAYEKTVRLLPDARGAGGDDADRLDLGALEILIGEIAEAGTASVSDRVLVDCGIVETPSAGYLPVVPSGAVTVNEQVRRLLGPGVDLRFCVVRPDFVPHALEEAQHMERICLVSGIEDPTAKPELDILVPDGEIVEKVSVSEGTGHRAELLMSSALLQLGRPRGPTHERVERGELGGVRRRDARLAAFDAGGLASVAAFAVNAPPDLPPAGGAARTEETPGGGFALRLAAASKETGVSATSSAAAFDDRRGSRSVEIDVWTELSLGSDPFSAQTGALVPIDLRFLLAGEPAGARALEERTLSGAIRVEKVAAIKDGIEVAGRMSADGVWRSSQTVGGVPAGEVETLSLTTDVVLRRIKRTGLPPDHVMLMQRLSLFSGLPDVQLVFESDWQSPTLQRSRLLLRRLGASDDDVGPRPSKDTPLLEARLTRDDAVLVPRNPHRERAIGAISEVAAALGNPTFEETAIAALFPPPAKPVSNLEVRGRLPWVLFHRRRTKTCSAEAPEAVPTPSRTYRIYAVDTRGDLTPESLAEAIATNLDGLLAKLPPKPDGTVTFAPALPNVETPHGDLRAGWEGLVGGSAELMHGLIASEGDALDDGAALASARLASATTVLAPVSPTGDGYGSEAREVVPAALDTASVDGAILYFHRSVRTVCHAVYRLAVRRNDDGIVLKQLERYFADPSRVTLTGFMKEIGGVLLRATPSFPENGDNYRVPNEGAQLQDTWDLAGGGIATDGFSVSAEDADPTLVAVQSTRVASSAGAKLEFGDDRRRTLDRALFNPCDRATVLVVESECHSVVLCIAREPVDATLEKLVAEIEAGNLPDGASGTDDNGRVWRPLGELDFFSGGDAPEPGSHVALRTTWESLGGRFDAGGAALVTVPKRTEDAELVNARGVQVAKALGADPARQTTAEWTSDGRFPVSCDAMTVVVVNTVLF